MGLPASTAESLMRSRYVAFVVGNYDHLARTYAPEHQIGVTRAAAAHGEPDIEWTGLEICGVVNGGPEDDTGTVEFKARFRQNGTTHIHHERSRFRRQNGQWFYIDGIFNPDATAGAGTKVGRNDPCICGSGRKYKLCCGR
jgi:SEC-C motif-containing protein